MSDRDLLLERMKELIRLEDGLKLSVHKRSIGCDIVLTDGDTGVATFVPPGWENSHDRDNLLRAYAAKLVTYYALVKNLYPADNKR